MAHPAMEPRRIPPFSIPSNIFSQGQDPTPTVASTEFPITNSVVSTSIPLSPAKTSSTYPEPEPSNSGSSSFPTGDLSSYTDPYPSSSWVIPTPTPSMESYSASVSSSATLHGTEPTGTPVPTVYPVNRHHSGLSPGAIAAAVIVPLLALLAIAFLALFCIRRRRRQAAATEPTDVPPVVLSEKKSSWSNWRGSTVKPATAGNPTPAPIITSSENNAYNTGLDTSSRGSRSINGADAEYYRQNPHGGSDDFASSIPEPPPPYNAKSRVSPPRSKRSTASSTTAPQLPPLAGIPALREPSPSPAPIHERDLIARGPSPFDDPPSPLQAPNPSYLNTPSGDNARPTTSRSDTARSFTSTLYSDSASVHSARAERVSFAIQQQQQPRPGQDEWRQWQHQRGASDPFADARGGGAVSPVSALEEETGENRARPKSEGWFDR